MWKIWCGYWGRRGLRQEPCGTATLKASCGEGGGGEIGLAKKEKERSQRKSYQKGDTSLSQSCEIGKRVVTVFNIEKVPCGFHSLIAVLIHGRPLFENWMQQKIVSSKLPVLFSVTNRNVF